jgi:hypothetical protein
MKFRKNAVANPEPDASREEVRTIAEALSLYRSAMHHIADREAARPFAAEHPRRRTLRLRLLLAPALAAAVAAAVLVPVYSHLHRHHPPASVTAAIASGTAPVPAPANVDDTVLMNQINSELSEDVPDALQPLADLSDLTTTNSASEKKNVTQE